MSYQATDAVLKRSRSKGAARLVLLVIASHADAEGRGARLSMDTIAREANASARSVTYAVAELEGELDELVIVEKGNGKGNASVYDLSALVLKGAKSAPKEGVKGADVASSEAERVQKVVTKGANSSSKGANLTDEKGADFAPQPDSKDIRTFTEDSSASLQNPVGLPADEGEVEKRAKALRKAIAELPKHRQCAQPKPEEWALMLDIFAEWKREMGKNGNAKLTPERGRAMLDRMRSPVGFTREDFSRAIKGCRASPRHMGHNERGEVYDDLELICRTDQHLEKFIGYAETGDKNGRDGRPQAATGGDSKQAGERQPSRRERNVAELRRQASTPMFTGTPTRRAG